MATTLIYTQDYKLTIEKRLDFDVEIRLHPRILTLGDQVVETILPEWEKFDVLVFPFRQVEHFVNPFASSKEDTPSYFESYESRDGIIHSNYIGPDLHAIEPISERWNKPIGRFDSIKTIGISQKLGTGEARYILLSTNDVEQFKSLYDYTTGVGVSCLVSPDTHSSRVVGASESMYTEFDFAPEYVKLQQEVLDDTTIPYLDVPNNTKCLVVYRMVLYIPIQKEYNFGISGTASNNGDEAIEIHVDGSKVLGFYDYRIGSTVWSLPTTLSQGFHTIVIHRVYRKGGNSKTILFDDGTSQVELSVSGLSSIGIPTYTSTRYIPIDDVETDFTTVDFSVNEYSLIAEQYVPVSTLVASKDDIANNFNMKYSPVPDSIETDDCQIVTGQVDNLLSSQTYFSSSSEIANVGVVLQKEAGRENEPFRLILTYEEPIKCNQVTIRDFMYSSSNYRSSETFFLKLFDKVGDFIPVKDTLAVVDVINSFNVANVDFNTGYVVISKEDVTKGFTLRFSEILDISRVEILVPLENNWLVTKVDIGVIDYNNFVVYDEYGNVVDISTTTSELRPVLYDNITAVPEVFKHDTIPSDIKRGSEFIIFGLDLLVDSISIEKLGTSFDVKNENDSPQTRKVYLNIHNLFTGKYTFNVYRDFWKTQPLAWQHVVYDKLNGTLTGDDLTTITAIVIDQSGSGSSGVYTLKVPHYEHSWTASVSGTAVPCVGYNRNGTLVDQFDQWDSNLIAIQTSVPSAGQISVTLTPGSFSPVSSITQSFVTQDSYSVDFDKYDTSLIITEDVTTAPHSTSTLFVMKDPASASSSITVDDSYVSYYEVYIIDKAARDTMKELVLDISGFKKLYGRHVPFQLVDAYTRESIDYCFRNELGSYTEFHSQWRGNEIVANIPLRPEGTKLLLTTGVGGVSPNTFTIPTVDDLRVVDLWLPFNTKVVDRSVYQHKVLSTENVEFVFDKEGNMGAACGFQGSGHIILDYSNPSNNLSISFWILPLGVDCDILNFMSNISELSCYIGSDGFLYLLSSGNLVSGDVNLRDGKWHHVCFTVDTTNTLNLYIDKQLVVTETISVGNGSQLNIGGQYIATTGLIGKVDEFRIYHRVLTTDEIDLLYDNFLLDYVDRDIEILTKRPTSVTHPQSMVTNLLDLKSLNATPMLIYKYLGIDVVLVEELN